MPTQSPHTIKLHRGLRAPAERVYRAFIEPAAQIRWTPPYGYLAEMQHSDVRVGGGYRMSFTNFRTKETHSFGGTYKELTPFQCIRYSDRFDDPSMQNEMQVTVTFTPVTCGTELTIIQENIPAQIPAEMCYLGWQESLLQLAQLVEPEIP
jgi:uncharacterized protein YndB with AHSA1/START domain